MSNRRFIRASVVCVSVCALTLAGCSGGGKDTKVAATSAAAKVSSAAASAASEAKEASSSAASSAMETSTSATDKAAVLTNKDILFKDAYVKAANVAKSGDMKMNMDDSKKKDGDKKMDESMNMGEKTAGMTGMTAVFGTLVNDSDQEVHLVGFTDNTGATMHQLHETINGKMKQKEGGFIIPAHSQKVFKPGGDHLMIMGMTKDLKPGETISVTLKFANGSEVKFPSIPVRELAAGNEKYVSDEK